MDDLKRTLLDAVGRYSYPRVFWDFSADCEAKSASMRHVEIEIHEQLTSGDPQMVAHGLANVVYWGFYSSRYYMRRFQDFLDRVTSSQLSIAATRFATLRGPDLAPLKELHLPQFTNVTFLSKLRMFLDPTRYVALDRHLARIGTSSVRTLFSDLKTYKSSIPCDGNNMSIYARWCDLCERWGRKLFLPAVDVERAIYTLAKEARDRGVSVDETASTVAQMERG